MPDEQWRLAREEACGKREKAFHASTRNLIGKHGGTKQHRKFLKLPLVQHRQMHIARAWAMRDGVVKGRGQGPIYGGPHVPC